MAPTAYTSISIPTAARDAARRMAAAMTGHTGQRISMGDALRIAERIVAAHHSEIAAVAASLGIIATAEPTPEGTDQ
jgi:hypothetical protein